jgi:hypothetical protein
MLRVQDHRSTGPVTPELYPTSFSGSRKLVGEQSDPLALANDDGEKWCQRLNGTTPRPTHLLPHQRLLHRREVLQRSKNHIRVLLASHVLHEPSQLLREHQQDLVLIIKLVLEERDQLVPCPLRAEREGDGGEAPDGGQAEDDVLRFELVQQEVDRVEFRVGVGHGGRSRRSKRGWYQVGEEGRR